jgi:protein SCO1/2
LDRRNFLRGLGLAPFVAAAPALAQPYSESKTIQSKPASRPLSRAAQAGYLPNVPLVTHTGKRVRFYDDLIRDRTVLFNFFLVGCLDGICPTTTANLRETYDLLGERMGRDIFFYTITLEPLEDTPKRLREYIEYFSIKPDGGWLFLTGHPQDIQLLRRSQGFFDPDPERDANPNNHTGMARYGNDDLERWGAISVRSKPTNIASTFKWLTL